LFDPAQIREYQHTKAPDEWKDEILAAADAAKTNRKPRLVAMITSLAACLVLLVVGGLVINAYTSSQLPSVSVSINDVTPFAVARSDEMSRVQITLTADGEIVFESSSPDLYVVSDNNHSMTLEWLITTDSVTFTANGEHHRLTFDAANGNVSVSPIVSD